MKQIDSGPEGIVIGVTENHEVYRRAGISNTNYIGKEWVKIDGSLTHVSCGRSGCWGVDSTEHVYYIDGVLLQSCLGPSLVAVDGKMKQVEVGEIEDVYAINNNGNLYVRLGVTKINIFGSEWKFLRQASYVTSGWTGQYVLVDNMVYESSGKNNFYHRIYCKHESRNPSKQGLNNCFVKGKNEKNNSFSGMNSSLLQHFRNIR